MRTYNKLVRDRIPELIQRKGEICTSRVAADDEEYRQKLRDKLEEEVNEFLLSHGDPGELADILEVVQACAAAAGVSWEDLLVLKAKKRAERGGFERRIILIES